MPKAVLGEAGRRIQRRNALQKNIRAKMAGEEYTQSQLGKELGISQVAASQKIKKLQFLPINRRRVPLVNLATDSLILR